MIKLVDLLKEINESKQVGLLYHFTPLSNLISILTTYNLIPNDEGQISTSRRPNMSTRDFQDMVRASIARLTLDGDKISNKYKVHPFAFGGDEGSPEDLGEEQIVVNGKKFPFIPYLKRIDIFLNKKEKVNNKIIELLEKANIPYKVYQGIPISNIPYTQPKTGNPEDINVSNIPKKEMYTPKEMYFLGMKTKEIKIYTNSYSFQSTFPDPPDDPTIVGLSPDYPDYYLGLGFKEVEEDYFNLKGEKINTKYIPIPMYDDPKWRKMWKTNVYPPYNIFHKGHTYDSYVLIPKNEV